MGFIKNKSPNLNGLTGLNQILCISSPVLEKIEQ